MQIRQQINPQIISAAVGMLQPFIPGLSPQNLVDALENHHDMAVMPVMPKRPMTRREAAAFLSCSLATINRYMNSGKLKRIRLNDRTVRVDADSVYDLVKTQTSNVQ